MLHLMPLTNNTSPNEKANKADEEYDDIYNLSSGDSLGAIENSRVSKTYDIYLDEDIKEPKYYRRIIHLLNTSAPNDAFRIWINTNGGMIDGALAIIEAMNTCQSDILTIASGRVYSSGSIIALNSKKLAIQPTSRWMVHSASYGYSGKMHETKDFFSHSNHELEKLITDTYAGFLTETEISELLNGKDFWFNYDESVKRYKRKVKYLNLKDKELNQKDKEKEQVKQKQKKKVAK